MFDETAVAFVQVKRNVQRTLAGELQKLSVAFRKQQKQHLNRLRQRDGGAGGSFLQDDGRAGGAGADDDYDPGFSDVQVSVFGTVVTGVAPDREEGPKLQALDRLQVL